jgi:hypothetical protein
MTLPANRSPLADDPSRPEGTTPSWAADMAEADPARLQGVAAAPQQMPLFHADDLAPASAPARPRRARLPGRLKALLSAPASPGSNDLPNLSWPDSFFDVSAGS